MCIAAAVGSRPSPLRTFTIPGARHVLRPLLAHHVEINLFDILVIEPETMPEHAVLAAVSAVVIGFNLSRALEVDPAFMEPEYPFEWGGVFDLRQEEAWVAA